MKIKNLFAWSLIGFWLSTIFSCADVWVLVLSQNKRWIIPIVAGVICMVIFTLLMSSFKYSSYDNPKLLHPLDTDSNSPFSGLSIRPFLEGETKESGKGANLEKGAGQASQSDSFISSKDTSDKNLSTV